ncbi:MAG TPA: hypothetical protein VFG39_08580 [Balneolaceae bacterium]|nr:hypothetical protein [Balneolaceae bacterium]
MSRRTDFSEGMPMAETMTYAYPDNIEPVIPIDRDDLFFIDNLSR